MNMEMGGSSESEMLKIGLKFGKKVYFEDAGVGGEAKSGGGLSPAAGGGGGGDGGGGGGAEKKGQQAVGRCQVEGCNMDLSEAKTYYSRHKVCGVHSKTPMVIVNGLQQRFHQLPEFDQGKRSCRRRLAGHNQRRRKPPPETMLSGSLSPSIFENDGRSGGFLMDFSTYSRESVEWPNNTRTYNNPLPRGSNSNVALSLLSNESYLSGPGNQSSSLEYYVDPGVAPHMVQPSGAAMCTWGYNPNEPHMGSGHIPQADYSGEVQLGQQSRFTDSTDHAHWSI